MKRTLWTRIGFPVMMIGLVLAGMQTAFAASMSYDIGPGKTFATLEALRTAGVLASGDTIILYQDDDSLTDRLVNTGSSYTLTIQSNDPAVPRVIRPAEGATINDYGGFFRNNVNTSNINLAGVRFEQFSVTGGWGGVVRAYNLTLTGTAGTNTFSGNSVIANGNLQGWGGAIDADNLTINGGTWQFTNNLADGKDYDDAGVGGAIHAYGVIITGANTVFTGNRAVGGSGNISGRGGAILSGVNGLTITGGNHLFSGNSAVGGSGNFSGQGGAICSAGDTTLSGNIAFLNNRAETTDPSNLTSGLGGAIYMDAWGGTRTFNLTTTATGQEILFLGNSQQNGLNSVYFGNTSGGSGTINATFDTAAGSSIYMYDPMESQANGLGGAGNVTLNLTKTGDGLWLLGGTSNLNSAATVAITGGTFRLDRDAQLNLNNASLAHFSVASGATFTPTIDGPDSVSTIKANNFVANPGANLKVAGISSLAAGSTTFENAIVANTWSVAPSFVDTPTSGLMYGSAEYAPNYTSLNLDLVVSDVKNMSDEFGTDPFLDVYRQTSLASDVRSIFDEIYDTGVYGGQFDDRSTQQYFEGVKGNTVLNATGAHLISTRIFHRIMLDRMNPNAFQLGQPSYAMMDSDVIYRGQSCNSRACRKATLWGEFSQNWATQGEVGTRSGYEYRPFAFTFGKERQIGRWIAGLAGEYSHGNMKGGNAVWTDSQLDTAAVGLYAGYFGRCNYLKGNMQFGVGWNKQDSFDRLNGTQTHGSFHSAVLGTGLEFGRTFGFLCKVNPLTLTPHLGTDYWFLNREAFDETGTNARSFGSVNYNVVEIPIGLRIARTIPMIGGKANSITPSIDLVYARSIADDAPISRAGFIGIPATWTAHGTELGRDIFRMNTAVTGRYCHFVDVGLGFDLEARNHYTAEQLNLTVAITR